MGKYYGSKLSNSHYLLKSLMFCICQSDGNAFFKAPPYSLYTAKIYNHMIVGQFSQNYLNFSFLDVNTGQQVSEIFFLQLLIEQRSCAFPQVREMLEENGICCYGHCELFIHYKDCNLKIWRMNAALDMKFVRSLHLPANIPNGLLEWGNLDMDDEYIAILIHAAHSREGGIEGVGRWCTVYLVSTKTLEIERSLCFARKFVYKLRYERGFLILLSSDSIR